MEVSEKRQCPAIKAGEQCLGVEGHRGRHQYESDPPKKLPTPAQWINDKTRRCLFQKANGEQCVLERYHGDPFQHRFGEKEKAKQVAKILDDRTQEVPAELCRRVAYAYERYGSDSPECNAALAEYRKAKDALGTTPVQRCNAIGNFLDAKEYEHQCKLDEGHRGDHVFEDEPKESKDPVKAMATGDVTEKELEDIRTIAKNHPLHVIIQAAMMKASLTGMRLRMTLSRPAKKKTGFKKKG
jgi:hypothetical protein